MSMNWEYGRVDAGVTLAITADGNAGDVRPIGADGLTAYFVTDTATADVAAAGLNVGEASVRLLPTQGVISLPVTGATVGSAVYGTVSGGDVTYGATGGFFVGHAVTATDGNGDALVFLGSSAPAEE